MEQTTEKLLQEVCAQPDTIGCLLANKQGLCIAANGKINPNVSGVGVALAEQAAKLDPKQEPPTLCLYSGKKRCIIQKKADLTAVIFKQADN